MNSSKVLRIREKRDKIVNNPDCVMGCRKLEKKDLEIAANKHSVGIEIPNLRKSRGASTERILKSNQYSKLEQVWQKLSQNELESVLTHIFLQDCNQILIDSIGTPIYRNASVFVTESEVLRPNYMKVSQLMEKLFVRCRGLLKDENYECAALSFHLHMLYIHPFNDGNGRLARLFQNRILVGGNYPVPVIPENERDQYIMLVETGVKAVSREKYHEAEPFYDYVLDKINASLDRVLEFNGKHRM